MVQVYSVDADVCIVAGLCYCHVTLRVERYLCISFQTYVAIAFSGREISVIACAVGCQAPVECDAVRYAEGAIHLGIEKSCYKVQLLCLGIKHDVGLHSVQVCQVVDSSFDVCAQGGGQVDVDTRDFHMLHVAVE